MVDRAMALERGNLKILIISGQDLFEEATHVSVQVKNQTLITDKVDEENNPLWNELLLFKRYRPRENAFAKIKVWDNIPILPDDLTGTGQLPLPSTFNKLESNLIDLYDEDGGLC